VNRTCKATNVTRPVLGSQVVATPHNDTINEKSLGIRGEPIWWEWLTAADRKQVQVSGVIVVGSTRLEWLQGCTLAFHALAASALQLLRKRESNPNCT
jgi:hypothetical protein